MIANSPAAVAAAFSSSSSPVLPGDSRWAAIPEPITTAARNPLPRNSAVTRRHNVTGALLTALILTDSVSSVKIESMNTELTSELAARAAVHAALADPARLHIIDTLGAGDASPSELAAVLAMPSNLLAHHLHVLEQAGLITRRRSDGDRRRTYLQLIPGALESLTRPAARAAGRVLFVCTANSARSHLAAALWRRASTVPAVSAGTHPARADRSRRHRRRQAPPPADAPPAAPPHQRRPARRRPHGHRVRPGPRGTRPPGRGALVRPGPGPGRAIPPASTRRSPSSAAASSASHRAWPRPADLRPAQQLTAGCAPRRGHTTGPRRCVLARHRLDAHARSLGWQGTAPAATGGQPIRAPRAASACGRTR